LQRKLLTCLLLSPELARRPELMPGSDPDEWAELLRQVVEFVRGCPEVVSTAALIQGFAGGSHDARLAEIEREVAPLGPEFDAQAEFAGALRALEERRAQEARSRRFSEILAKSPEQWSPEDVALLRSGGRNAPTE